jgi:hypothetical protein
MLHSNGFSRRRSRRCSSSARVQFTPTANTQVKEWIFRRGSKNIARLYSVICWDLYGPVVNRTVLGLVQPQIFQRTDFAIRSDGVCGLHSEMARSIARLNLTFLQGLSVVTSAMLVK